MTKKPKTKGKSSPKKYLEWINDPDKLTLLQCWARDNYSEQDIAEKMGIAQKTLIEWKKTYPEIKQALSVGRELVDYKVENALLKSALGYEYTETETTLGYPDKNGNRKAKTVTTVKHQAGNVTAMLAWLNNRKPNDWKRNRDTAVTQQGDKEIVVKIVKEKGKKNKTKGEDNE